MDRTRPQGALVEHLVSLASNPCADTSLLLSKSDKVLTLRRLPRVHTCLLFGLPSLQRGLNLTRGTVSTCISELALRICVLQELVSSWNDSPPSPFEGRSSCKLDDTWYAGQTA